jgi:hypothetical protein
MNLDWQTLAALGIVMITLTVFLVRFAKPKKKSHCGHHCGCEKTSSAMKIIRPTADDEEMR